MRTNNLKNMEAETIITALCGIYDINNHKIHNHFYMDRTHIVCLSSYKEDFVSFKKTKETLDITNTVDIDDKYLFYNVFEEQGEFYYTWYVIVPEELRPSELGERYKLRDEADSLPSYLPNILHWVKESKGNMCNHLNYSIYTAKYRPGFFIPGGYTFQYW
jgi:hypothetical protein